jgi:DNA-directed RNA polymerase subunit RPC12/RpoP
VLTCCNCGREVLALWQVAPGEGVCRRCYEAATGHGRHPEWRDLRHLEEGEDMPLPILMRCEDCGKRDTFTRLLKGVRCYRCGGRLREVPKSTDPLPAAVDEVDYERLSNEVERWWKAERRRAAR